jgi:immune inhibitor InhA-like protein
VWNVAAQGAPDALGVLGHFKAVVWAVGGHTAGAATTLEVRDYLNEGGKLIEAGSAAGVNDPLNATRVNVDDFGQYWLGVDSPTRLGPPTGITGAGALAGVTASFLDPPAATAGFASISDTLPVATFPQFASASAGTYDGLRGPFEPFAGSGFAALKHVDNSYSRLTRTVDLTGVTGAQAPKLKFAFSYDTEPGFDSAIVEAHEVGTDAWTTLSDAGGLTAPSAPDDCASLLTEHPFLAHYLTVSGTTCAPNGTSGTWNRVTGSSDGWKQVSVDLSAFAGKQVEVAVAYVSDFSSGGHGAFVDEAELVVGGTTVDKADFESTLGVWRSTVAAGSGGTAEWKQSGAVLKLSAAISRKRSIVLGVGLESASAPQRAALVRQALKHLAV